MEQLDSAGSACSAVNDDKKIVKEKCERFNF